jgi:hypothetical protein
VNIFLPFIFFFARELQTGLFKLPSVSDEPFGITKPKQ